MLGIWGEDNVLFQFIVSRLREAETENVVCSQICYRSWQTDAMIVRGFCKSWVRGEHVYNGRRIWRICGQKVDVEDYRKWPQNIYCFFCHRIESLFTTLDVGWPCDFQGIWWTYIVQVPSLRTKRTWRIFSQSGELPTTWDQINLLEEEKPCGMSSQLSKLKPQAGVWTKVRLAKPSPDHTHYEGKHSSGLAGAPNQDQIKGSLFYAITGYHY